MYFNKQIFGWLIIALIPSISVFLWIISAPLSSRFTNFTSSTTSIGQLLGLIGFSLFSLTLVFNTRLKILEETFGGLNKVFPIHHLLGGITFILLLFHPLILAIRYLSVSVRSAALFLLPGQDFAITFGIAALDILVILLIITFFINLPYHKFQFFHQFLGVPFILASIHMLVIPSTVSFYLPLRLYLSLLSLIGLSAYTYRTVFRAQLVKRSTYKVEQINWLKENIAELVFSPLSKPLHFDPGQFVFVEFVQPGLSKEQHPYSLTSTPEDKTLTLVIKILGDFTAKLSSLQKGTVTFVEGPYGKFGQTTTPRKSQIWIAGGIGITPFLSLARSLPKNHPPIDLYYSVKDENEAIFLLEFQRITQTHKNFHLFLWFSSKRGRLDISIINKLSHGVSDKEILISASIPMIEGFKDQLLSQNVPSEQIHSEEFQLV